MYQKTSFITGLIITLLLASCSGSKQVYKVPDRETISTAAIATTYDNTAKLGYSISKDNSHLFITLSTKEKATQLKMMRNGVSIFFDKEGKKNKDYGVQYPVPNKNQALNIEEMKQMKEQRNQERVLGNGLGRLGTDILIIENGDERVINKELNSESITVAHQMSLDGLAYTLKVPLSYIKTVSNSPSVGIVVKGMERPEMGNRPSGGMQGGGGRSSGMRSGGGKMGGSGMRGGGGRSGGSGGRPDMSQIQELQSDINIWITLDVQ